MRATEVSIALQPRALEVVKRAQQFPPPCLFSLLVGALLLFCVSLFVFLRSSVFASVMVFFACLFGFIVSLFVACVFGSFVFCFVVSLFVRSFDW